MELVESHLYNAFIIFMNVENVENNIADFGKKINVIFIIILMSVNCKKVEYELDWSKVSRSDERRNNCGLQ